MRARARISLTGVLLALVLFSPIALAAEEAASSLLAKSLTAERKGAHRRSDYYAARYLGLCERDSSFCDAKAWTEFMDQRRLTPKAFVSGAWDPGFTEWFERSVRSRWGADDARVKERYRSFEISQVVHENKYFVTVVAIPELQQWHTLKDGIVDRPLILAMGSGRERPTVYFGRTLKGVPSMQFTSMTMNTQGRQLHFLYKPAFFDIDKDGVPEVWFRYNLSWGNGFSQFLDVYRIKDDRELTFLRRFEGLQEGYARLLPDGTVETATGVSSRGSAIRSDLDENEILTWTWRDGAFEAGPKRTRVPLVVRTPEWVSIYREN